VAALTLAVLAVVWPGLFGGASTTQAAPTAAEARAVRGLPGSSFGAPEPVVRGIAAAVLARAPRCRPVAQAGNYVNPLVQAKVKPERIDQGVDYAGKGSLIAIGAARITRVDAPASGWPGAYLEYRLSNGPDQGCYVYYAEGVTPLPGLRPGQTVSAGQAIAALIPGWATGIELGWAAGSGEKTYAGALGKWTPSDDADDVPTQAGKSFSALIAALGGPPGKVEG
jgi:hypothetical protein